jgi:hypothetical protein
MKVTLWGLSMKTAQYKGFWNQITVCSENVGNSEIVDVIKDSLGLSLEQVPLGLMPGVNEVFAAEGFPSVGTALPLLPGSETAQMASCELMSHIAQGPPSLVTTSKHKDLTKLIRRICSTFPSADIVVIVKNKNVGYKLVQALREERQNCWYLDKEYALKVDQPWPNHRIRVVKQDKLALWSLDLHRADIVVVTDAVEFVHNNYLCNHTEWFNTFKGTFIKPEARLVGVVDEDAHPRDMKLVYPIFGLRTFLLGANGKAVLAPLVNWLSRTKQDNSDKRVGNDQSIRNQKEKMIWQNQQRNTFIVKKINEVRRELAGYAFVQERYGADSGDALAVVVENTIHLTAFQAAMTVKGVSCPVLTFEDIQNASSLPAVLIRADAGTGLLPIRAQENPVLVLDIKDEAPSFLRRRRKLRNNAYQKYWHCGAMPFVEKWQSCISHSK